VAGWFSSRKLTRGAILGSRMGKLPKRASNLLPYIIVPVEAGKRELKLPPLLHVDKDFYGWIKTIPEIRK
jgi:hypothetical protein